MNAGKGLLTNELNGKNNYFPFGIPEIYYIVFPTNKPGTPDFLLKRF
jgi:hypothetical protein